MSEINNTWVDNAKDLGVVTPTHNLIEYCENYAKTSRRLWQYCKDDSNDNMTYSDSFKFKSRLTANTNNAGTANVEIAVPLKY